MNKTEAVTSRRGRETVCYFRGRGRKCGGVVGQRRLTAEFVLQRFTEQLTNLLHCAV